MLDGQSAMPSPDRIILGPDIRGDTQCASDQVDVYLYDADYGQVGRRRRPSISPRSDTSKWLVVTRSEHYDAP